MRLKITRTANDATYYGIQSTYVNGKHSSKIVMRLGKESELKKQHEDPEAWAKAYLAQLTEEEKAKDTKVRLELFPGRRIEPEDQQLYNGGYLFLQKIYYDLGLDQICNTISNKYKIEYDLNSILSRLIYGRIIHPSSKRETAEYSKTLIEQPKFNQHQVYRALDVLQRESDYIQSEVYKNSLKLGHREDGKLYYDCTNYYFEIEMESDDRQYGYSKEHRPNPIIQMGLMMDGDGIPLAYCLNPGNTNENITLRPLEKQIIRDFGHSEFVICTDAGLASLNNRKFNSIGNRKFVTVQSIKTMKSQFKEWALSPKGWHLTGDKKEYCLTDILSDENIYASMKDRIFYKEQWINEDNLEQRYIVTFSIKYMEYLRTVRARQVAHAEKAIKGKSVTKRSNSNDYKRFIASVSTTEDGEIAENSSFFLNTEAIADEAQYDGFYAVATNLEDSPEEIIKINKCRWEIEECFRIMKHEMKARPVYLQIKDRIRAHFLVCYLSLIIYRYLEKRLSGEFTCEQIISTISGMMFHNIPGSGWMPMYTRSAITDALHDSFGFHTDYQIVPSLDMKKICTSTRKKQKVLKNS